MTRTSAVFACWGLPSMANALAAEAENAWPQSSSDLDPIEPYWSKLKGPWLRVKAARRLDALKAELGSAIATFTVQDVQGWFCPCGYTPPN